MALQNVSLTFPSDGYFGLAQQPEIPFFQYGGGRGTPPNVHMGGNMDRMARVMYSQQSEEHMNNSNNNPYMNQMPKYTKVESSGGGGGKTSVHAVIDYDEDDFQENDPAGIALEYANVQENDINQLPASVLQNYHPQKNEFHDNGGGTQYGSGPSSVTPIQGPIFVRNGKVPVVPLYNSYPKLNNGTFMQIPIMWAALSLALGYEVRGDYIRGAPCIKRYHQLFCPTAGTSYPLDRIEKFIDDNKALMRRMYGEFETNNVEYGPTMFHTEHRSLRTHHHSSYYRQDSFYTSSSSNSKSRSKRQTPLPPKTPPSDSGRVDSCESKLEVVTPYWASNSAGKVRAIVNTQHFEQAIHQEVCSKGETQRCSNDCRCEQKYKWHRLLSYDPSNDCKGIFMDWFLFPSCCVCRCSPT